MRIDCVRTVHSLQTVKTDARNSKMNVNSRNKHFYSNAILLDVYILQYEIYA
jgi:hypothetical protein